jgi:hypothetical protein
MGEGWIYRQQYVKCGKLGCRCFEGEGHGPYWYGFRRRNLEGRGSEVESRYFGKERPRGARPTLPPEDARRAREYKSALGVFGLHVRKPTAEQVRRRYKELAVTLYSNEYLERERMQRVDAAHEVLRRRRGAGA